jgi:hypothetical protein
MAKITNRQIPQAVANREFFSSYSAHATGGFEGFGQAEHLTDEERAQVQASPYIVYSYKTPVAWQLADSMTLVVDAHKYSVTTSKLQGLIRLGESQR